MKVLIHTDKDCIVCKGDKRIKLVSQYGHPVAEFECMHCLRTGKQFKWFDVRIGKWGHLIVKDEKLHGKEEI